jgi:hypothetical protein
VQQTRRFVSTDQAEGLISNPSNCRGGSRQFACWRAVAPALQCLPMARLIRTSIVLIASYSIALQVILVGFAWASHARFGELAIICSSDGSNGPNGSLPERGDDCGFCQLACAAAPPALLPAGANLSLMSFVERPQPFAWSFETTPARARHQPQQARGPPLR